MSWEDIEFFDPKRDKMLSCPCCGLLNMDMKFMSMLDEARREAGVPFNITSGCRCISHNKEVGGSEDSSHIASLEQQCCAVDIACNKSWHRFHIISSLIAVGFTRIGIASTFIHVDSDSIKSQKLVWTY